MCHFRGSTSSIFDFVGRLLLCGFNLICSIALCIYPILLLFLMSLLALLFYMCSLIVIRLIILFLFNTHCNNTQTERQGPRRPGHRLASSAPSHNAGGTDVHPKPTLESLVRTMLLSCLPPSKIKKQ